MGLGLGLACITCSAMEMAEVRRASTTSATPPKAKVAEEPKSSMYRPLAPWSNMRLKCTLPASSVTLELGPIRRAPVPLAASSTACTG